MHPALDLHMHCHLIACRHTQLILRLSIKPCAHSKTLRCRNALMRCFTVANYCFPCTYWLYFRPFLHVSECDHNHAQYTSVDRQMLLIFFKTDSEALDLIGSPHRLRVSTEQMKTLTRRSSAFSGGAQSAVANILKQPDASVMTSKSHLRSPGHAGRTKPTVKDPGLVGLHEGGRAGEGFNAAGARVAGRHSRARGRPCVVKAARARVAAGRWRHPWQK